MKVAIATPLYGHPPTEYMAALLRTISLLNAADIDHEVLLQPGDTYVARARNALTSMFLEGDSDLLFMIDSDIGWSAEAFMRVLSAPHPCVAALYRMRNSYEFYTGREQDDAALDAHGCMPADRLPTGFMRCTREVMEKTWEAEPESYLDYDGASTVKSLFWAGPRDGLWWTEDFIFCEKVRAAGYPLHLMPDVTLAHIHPVAHVGNYAESLEVAA